MTVTEVEPQRYQPAGRRRRPLVRLLAVLFVLTVLVQATGSLVRETSGSTDTIARVGETGVRVAHPAVFGTSSLSSSGFTDSDWRGRETHHYTFHNVALQRTFDYTLGSTWSGQLTIEGDLSTPLDDVLTSRWSSPSQARRYADSLPLVTVTAAVLVLKRPMRTAELERGENQLPAYGLRNVHTLFYTDPRVGPEQVSKDLGRWVDNPVSWPTGRSGDDTLRKWTDRLGHGDDQSLRELGLPESDDLKRIAREDQVYALYATELTPGVLRDVLDDPMFETFLPVETHFDVAALPEE